MMAGDAPTPRGEHGTEFARKRGGIALARALLGLLARQLAALPIVLPHLQRVSLNGRVLVFNAALCLLLALLCSLAPVLAARRTDIQLVLRGHSGGAPRG